MGCVDPRRTRSPRGRRCRRGTGRQPGGGRVDVGAHRNGRARWDGRLSRRPPGDPPQSASGSGDARGEQRRDHTRPVAISNRRRGLRPTLRAHRRIRRARRLGARTRGDEGVVPPDGRRPGRFVSRDRARPARLRRFPQTADRGLRSAVLRARGDRIARCAGTSPRACRR